MPTAYNRGKGFAAQPPEGVTLRKPQGSGGTKGSYGSEDEAFLYGPTQRPEEPVSSGSTSAEAPPPAEAFPGLLSLLKAAEAPGAPVELQQFVRLLQEQVQRA